MSGPILIAGGGIGGLAVAVALAHVGFHVRVLEARTTQSEDGAGIQIGPNGVHALHQLGIADGLNDLVGMPVAVAVMEAATGRNLARLPLVPRMEMKHGAPYRVARRADLHGALLAKARTLARIEIVPGFRVDAIEQTQHAA